MKTRALALALVALSMPVSATAQEAYMQQIQAGPATVSVPALPSAPRIEGIVRSTIQSLTLTAPSVAVAQPDLSAYTIPALPDTGAYAAIDSTGTDHIAAIQQLGLQAASIRQTGAANNALISQTGRANRAAVYQSGGNATAIALQSGSNNTALIVQR